MKEEYDECQCHCHYIDSKQDCTDECYITCNKERFNDYE